MADQGLHEARSGREKPSNPSKIKKSLFVVAGTIFLALGCVGIALPVLPTTPFLLLSAACYYKGSERMHRWILDNRWFGNYIRNYKEGKGMPFKTKVFTLAVLWLAIGYSAFFVVNMFVFQVALFAIAFGVSFHLIALPTLRQK